MPLFWLMRMLSTNSRTSTSLKPPFPKYCSNRLTNNGFVYEYKIVRDNKAIHDLTVALSRIGNNLNQLMRYFHQNGASTTGIENDIRCCIRQIYDMSSKLDNIEVSGNGNP